MTSSSRPPDSGPPDRLPIILGLHADDTLNVFVRDGDNQLHQAARISTRNGVDPMMMLTIMADLSETLGWRQIVSAPPEAPQPSRELPRGVRAATAATVRAPSPPPKAQKPPQRRNPARRTREAMRLQEDTIMAIVNEAPREQAVTTRHIINEVVKRLGLPVNMIESNVRHDVDDLARAGRIGIAVDSTVLVGGRPKRTYYRLTDEPAVPESRAEAQAQVWNEAAASVALDGVTQS